MYKKLIKQLSSLKLAVVVIISIAFITAIGTFVESKYDAITAKKIVYDSIFMTAIMLVLATNLIAVMIDRWPWKTRHAPFLCAHVGILMIMIGQSVTSQFGIDGTMRVGIMEDNRFVTLNQTDITVYSSFDGNNYSKIFEKEVDFFKNPPSSEKPFEILKNQIDIKFKNYYRYALSSRQTNEATNPKLGAGVRFQISNGQANFIEWLVQRSPAHVVTQDLGPLKVHLGKVPEFGNGANEIYLKSDGKGVQFALFAKDALEPRKKGYLKEGEVIPTGWMGLELRILRYLPMAEETWKIEPRETPTPLTSEAVELEFEGKSYWMLLNDTVKLFSKNVVFFVSYANRRMDIGFPIFLNEFKMDRYQGTQRAASYKSIVTVPELGSKEISMNEPLKHSGLTIYQASFQDGPMGAPVASIFSINKDPGRWLKYLGSLIMSVGIILLFYFKKMGQVGHKAKS